MTLLVRDEADIVDAQLAFHLNSGVDFVIATDNDSQDGTTEILESYQRDGYLHLLRSHAHDHSQPEIVTHMARLAAASGADWVINSDADEFWWPRGGSLAEILAEIPSDYGTVHASVRTFVPRTGGVEHFAERMIVRAVPHAPLFEPTSAYRPVSKVVHRAHPAIIGWRRESLRRRRSDSRHCVAGIRSRFSTFRGARPTRWTRKARIQAGSERRCAGHPAATRRRSARERSTSGSPASLSARTRSIVGWPRDRSRSTRAFATRCARWRVVAGSLLAFVLVRSPARRFAAARVPPLRTLVDEAAYAIDTGVLAEAEILRAQKRLDALDARIATLERRFVPRVTRRLRRSRSAPDGDPRS